jgi:peptidoglycan/xylan/chitin deacetylase (PgdA/CDA1 family)
VVIGSARRLITSGISVVLGGRPAARAGRLLVLIYHRVRATRDPMFAGDVDSKAFDWQMELVRRHCSPISMKTAVPALRSGRLPPRAVAVTFDDGYADNAEVALPILRRHGVPATFFVAPGFLDGGRMWNDSIIEAVRGAAGAHLDLRTFHLGVVSLGREETRGPLAEAVIRAGQQLGPSERTDRVNELCERIGAELPDDLMMTSAQVRSITDAGMEIGAHTMTHPILSALPATAARKEIDDSRVALEAITGQPVRSFAYPNGRPGEDYTTRDREIVSSLDFDWAVSTVRGVASKDSDTYQLPRFAPWDDGRSKWLLRLLMQFDNVR